MVGIYISAIVTLAACCVFCTVCEGANQDEIDQLFQADHQRPQMKRVFFFVLNYSLLV